MDAALKHYIELVTRPTNILVIDDDPAIGHCLEQLQAQFNCCVDVIAAEPKVIINRIYEKSFDIIFLDADLVSTTQSEILWHLQRQAHVGHVIVMSKSKSNTVDLNDWIMVIGLLKKPEQPSEQFLAIILQQLGVKPLVALPKEFQCH
jgi:DNA-binding response OmpR family regulator